LSILLMVYLYVKNRHEQLFDQQDEVLQKSAFFISRPLSAALLVALFLSVWIYSEGITTVVEMILLLMVIPVIRLTPGIISRELQKPVYILTFLFILDSLQKNAVGFALVQRLLLLVAALIGIIMLIVLMREARITRIEERPALSRWFWKGLPVILGLAVICAGANIYGSTNLARTVGWGTIESFYLLVIVYISATVATGLVTVLIRRRHVKAIQFMKTYAHNVERWAKFAINITALLIWMRATFRAFGIWEDLSAWYTALLDYQWTVGTMVISVNAIVDFIMVIAATFILTRIVKIILDMEIFPRFSLPKGLPAAISMFVRYTLVTLGLFLALSSVGIDLGKFSLLAGALGVGLGFGLQKIVANFISSLILAFGRTIRVGDTVKYNDVYGSITEIGVNATTVKTFDGSDVIIPNSDLISNRVVNWTLSDIQRRMELPVKVAFESDPHEVLRVLEKVAVEHPNVLNNPPPFAVFNGFGDYFLDFTLYYWIPSSLYFQAKTEIALAVYDQIRATGISIPRPQRDLKLSMESPSAFEPAIVKAVRAKKADTAADRKKPPPKKT
jgi:small-conductance mechanosensitive channel